jgi:putative hydrolase of the HAD superfamily
VPIRAVIFDLWDTLVDYPVDAAAELERRWAERLGQDPEAFRRLWREQRAARETGPLVDGFRAAGIDEAAVEELLAMRHEFTRGALVPREGATETLRRLRELGLRLGLISVCSEEVALLWQETPFAGLFDSTVFSATCGLRKPDPEIYLLACRELGVEPRDCVFVGDGANDELAGAERVGMDAVLIHRPEQEPHWPEVRGWRGRRITSIPEVLDLVSAADAPAA